MSVGRRRPAAIAAAALLGVVAAATPIRPAVAAAVTAADCVDGTEVCVRVDTGARRGPAKLRAQGFLHGVAGNTPGPELVAPLKPQSWRTSTKEYYDATKGTYGGTMTFIVRDWFWVNSGGQTSWTDWANYESYLKTMVHKSIDEGWPVDYWDVFNEPDAVGSPSCATNDPCAAATQLQEIEHAVNAIRSVDPNAKIIVPSTNVFRATAGVPKAGAALVQNLDIETVLDFLKLRNIKVDAISWHELSVYRHENYDLPVPQSVRDADVRGFVSSPRVVLDHVAKVREMIAAKGLGPMEIHLNEYGTPSAMNIPGWEAGWINAMEDADVDAALHSCWWLKEGTDYNHGCFGPDDSHTSGRLDGLVTNNVEPKATYWVHRFYADMTGDRLATSTSDPQLGHGPSEDGARTAADITSAFATRDDATSTVRALVGRHYSCLREANVECSSGNVRQWDGYRPVAPAAPGAVVLTWPYASGPARVSVHRLPTTDIQGPLAAPVEVSTTALDAVAGEALRVDLGSFADGEAYTVTVEPDPGSVVTAVVPELPAPALVALATAAGGLLVAARRRRATAARR
jgi:hypothetical protein